MRKHHLAILGAAGAAIAGGLVFHCHGDAPHLSTATAAPADARWAPLPRGVAPAAARLVWADATRYEYDLSWSSHQESRVAADSGTPQTLSGSVELDATLVARVVGREPEATLLAVGLEDIERADLQLLGRPLLPDDAAVSAALGVDEAVLELAADGRLRGVRFPPEAQPVFVHLIQALAAELSMTLPSEPTTEWRAEEPNALGTAEVRYAIAVAEPLTIARSRERYSRLSGLAAAPATDAARIRSRGDLILDRDGTLRAMTGAERVSVTGPGDALWAETELALRLTGRAAAPPEQLLTIGWRRLGPGEMVAFDDPKTILEQRIDGLTAERMVLDLRTHAAAGELPDHNHWLWQATGLLKAQPALCAQLVELFAEPSIGAKGRSLIVDLLASVGSREAQAAMRTILAGKAHDDEVPQLVQRFAIVTAPEPETIAFLRETMAAAPADSDARLATAYTIGSTAGHAAEAGDGAAARKLVGELRDALDDADDDHERAALIAALGNSRAADQLPLLVDRAGAESREIRRAAADALYGYDAADATATLLALLADPDIGVQDSALRSLDHRTLGEAELTIIAGHLRDGRLSAAVDATLVDLLAPRLRGSALAAEMLRFVRDRNDDQAAFVARIDALLSTP